MPKRQGQLIVDSQATGGSITGTITAIGGSGSGLDADKLDGLHATAFLLADGTRAVSSLTPVRLVASDSGKLLESVADLTAWVAGTSGTVTVTDDADGTLTLDLDDPLTVANIEISESLTLTGAAQYVRHIQIPAISTGNPSNQPTPVDFFTAGGLQFGAALAKYSYCQWEIPDDWDGGDIYFEVDWMPDSGATSGTDTVEWTIEYRAIAEGEAINNGTSKTLTSTDSGDYAQYQTKHARVTMPYDDANQPLAAQDHVYFKISRNVAVANDFGGSVTVLAYEIIYTSTGFPSN